MKTLLDKDLMYALILLGVLGALLLFFGKPLSEGFQSGPVACGVDNPCSGHLKCINGFCAATDPVPPTEKESVPLLPPAGPAPYF
jgi:hypothetical protein